MEFPFHIYDGIDRLAEETKNEHFQSVVDWIDRYAFGCNGAGGEFSYVKPLPPHIHFGVR